jgi:hypothetical protein
MVCIDFLYLNRPDIDHGHIPDLSSNIKIPGEYCIFNRTVKNRIENLENLENSVHLCEEYLFVYWELATVSCSE